MDGSMIGAADKLAVNPTHDEFALQNFTSTLRKVLMVDMAEDMKAAYENEVKPAFEKEHGRAPQSGQEVRRAMKPNLTYQVWSSLRYNAQEMTWDSVIPTIERGLPELTAKIFARETEKDPTGGSLTLDPALEIPDYVTAMDIHLMPGCFQTERSAYDISQGAVYYWGVKVFSGSLYNSGGGDVARAIAYFTKHRYPELEGRKLRILDIGCTTGNNTTPWLEAFPGAELYGIDVGAPVLRFAHARAVEQGLAVHYSQQNAEATNFPDDYFDIVTSSFFFHEMSVKATARIKAEIHRILKPGGMMLHMELPPGDKVGPYENFYLDWDAYYNNEPHYAAYRAQDLKKMVIDAGFAPENYLEMRVPNRSRVSPEDFIAAAKGKDLKMPIFNGGSWFIYGGRK